MDKFNSYKYLIEQGTSVGAALLILIIGLIIAKIVRARMRTVAKSRVKDPTAALFITNAVYGVLLLVLFIIVLTKLGVPSGSLLTILGAGSVAIGLAIKNSLSNVASGLLLIFLRPFRIGDFVDAGGVWGTVDQINLFTTRLKTTNNECVYLPNAQIMNNKIQNNSKNMTRRLDLTIGISYGSDIKKAKAITEELFKQEPRILKDPAPAVMVKELADSSVNLAVRPWVKKADYTGVMFDLLENIKLEFDKQGIEIPFPQMDVHLSKESE